MEVAASAFGHEIMREIVSGNASSENATMDFSIVVPHWFCNLELETRLSFEHDGSEYEVMNRHYYDEDHAKTTQAGDFSDEFNVGWELERIDDRHYKLVNPGLMGTQRSVLAVRGHAVGRRRRYPERERGRNGLGGIQREPRR